MPSWSATAHAVMQDSPAKAFNPDQLAMLAEVLNEVLSTVEPPR